MIVPNYLVTYHIPKGTPILRFNTSQVPTDADIIKSTRSVWLPIWDLLCVVTTPNAPKRLRFRLPTCAQPWTEIEVEEDNTIMIEKRQ